MSKKNTNKRQLASYFTGDTVYVTDIGEHGRIIGKSYNKKDHYVVELNEGGTELFTANELEKRSPEQEYDDGLREGQSYSSCIRDELLNDVRDFALHRSKDYAEGYLHAAITGLITINDNIDVILEEEE